MIKPTHHNNRPDRFPDVRREDTKRHLTEVQASLKEAEAVKLKMTAELEQSQLVKEERKKVATILG